MSVSLVVDATDLKNMSGRIGQSKGVVRTEITNVLRQIGLVVQAEERRQIGVMHKIDTHKLQGSIAVKISGYEASIGSDLAYAAPVNFGRRAGAKMPPKDVLLGWMSRHGIDPRLEFVIRRAIKRRGIKPAPFVDNALRNTDRTITKLLDQSVTHLLGRMM